LTGEAICINTVTSRINLKHLNNGHHRKAGLEDVYPALSQQPSEIFYSPLAKSSTCKFLSSGITWPSRILL